MRASVDDHTIRNQFPQVFDLKVIHAVFVFYVVELAVAAVAGDNNHLRTRRLDLIHLFLTIENSFFPISSGHGSTAAAAADLMQPVRIQIEPVFDALIENPAGFVKESVAEPHKCLAPVVAGIVIGCRLGEASMVNFDPAVFDILYQQIKHCHKVEFFYRLGIIFF